MCGTDRAVVITSSIILGLMKWLVSALIKEVNFSSPEMDIMPNAS